VRSNKLASLPAEIGDCGALVSLYLTDNALRFLPPTLGRLRRLRKLQAASNKLQALPDELAALPELVREGTARSGGVACTRVRLSRVRSAPLPHRSCCACRATR
jgi:Leucine-rich repeat (LRR) protein